MKWILENLQIVVAIVAAIAYYLTRGRGPSQDETPRRSLEEDPEQAERTRRVQEEIRRKIAERRSTADETTPPASAGERIPPMVRPAHVPPVDPFGGPLRRIMREMEQKLERQAEPLVDEEARARAAELQRQANLAEELRALEAARQAEQRRAEARLRERQAIVVAARAEDRDWARRLKDPRELRRAVILREILGRPVGLR